VKDGHVFLSMMADGGIYEFEPINGKYEGFFDSLLERVTAAAEERQLSPQGRSPSRSMRARV
jgi:hypothetical protein